MAVSFACPACKTLIQVGEELTGQTGQCPRCERLLLIPSASNPVATLLDAAGKPVPVAPPTPAHKPTPKLIDDDMTARAARRSVERKPAGPNWPWAVGILGGIAVFALLVSAFVTLVTYRPRQERSNVIVVEPRPWNMAPDGVTHGELEGNTAVLARGEIFQIRGSFTQADVRIEKKGDAPFPMRRFTVHLDPARQYVLEMDSKQLSSHIRLEHNNAGGPFHSIGQPGVRNAAIHRPRLQWDGPYVVRISCCEVGALGDFTLTIRQAHIPKPIE